MAWYFSYDWNQAMMLIQMHICSTDLSRNVHAIFNYLYVQE